MCQYVVLLCLFFSSLYGMEQRECQFELSRLRTAYRSNLAVINRTQEVQSSSVEVKPCVFCDSDTLKKNYIISEDKESDVRVILNKFPYIDLSQGIHILVLPISHKEQFSQFSSKEFASHIASVQMLSKKLHNDAYTQEYFINWGKLAGQSVPHLHSHLKVLTQPCMSMIERMQCNDNNQKLTIEDVFYSIKEKLKSEDNNVASSFLSYNPFKCHCCMVRSSSNDAQNFVIRLDCNYICLSHYPCLSGEISVVPYDHVTAIKDLSLDALYENMTLAKLLLGIMQKYADENIRQCDGCNVYIKSMGNKASYVEKSASHLHTRIMPRTTIAPTPGTLDNNSCKLDFNPHHLFDHLKTYNFKEMLKDQ